MVDQHLTVAAERGDRGARRQVDPPGEELKPIPTATAPLNAPWLSSTGCPAMTIGVPSRPTAYWPTVNSFSDLSCANQAPAAGLKGRSGSMLEHSTSPLASVKARAVNDGYRSIQSLRKAPHSTSSA